MLTPNDAPVIQKASGAIDCTGYYVWANATAGSLAMPLRVPSLRRLDASLYTVTSLNSAVTLNRSGTDQFMVNGVAQNTYVVYPGESVQIIDDGGYWLVLPGATPPAVVRKVSVQSGTSFTLNNTASLWVFTGTAAATWTLPALSARTGLEYLIKNRGSADLIVQRAGSDQLYTTEAVSSITVAAGSSAHIVNDGTYWDVM